MEKSIKRVERLVHATNSALAQMKLSLMFDDLNSENTGDFRTAEDFQTAFDGKLLDGDDLKQCQKEFNSEASEMLAKIERIFGSKDELNRRNSKALERIKEINKKMKTPVLEQSESGETQQSRQKLLSLIGEEKFSPGITSSKGSVGSKRGVPLMSEKRSAEKACCAPKKAEALKTPVKSKEELKSKILETQEIVDRGFQTARQLAHKVDSITKCERKEKTPSTEKAASDVNLKSAEGKSESNENLAKSRRSSAKEKRRKRDHEEEELKVNAHVIDIKRKESQRIRKSNLRVQHLPSVHIRGELQLQKIHNLEISTAGDAGVEKSNTAVAFVSHERIEQEKMNEVIENVRKENCCCTERNNAGKYVECYHCGKLIRVCQTRVDPQKVDEILQMCDFNVFDPRIEEFVEKCGTVDTLRWCEETQTPDSVKVVAPGTPEPRVRPRGAKEEMKMEIKQAKQTKRDGRFTLQDLSDQIYKKYTKEADTLEGSHLRLDTILKNLFRKVDESREVFENCHFMKNQKFDSGRPTNLRATKPVLVSFDGDSTRIVRKRKKFSTAEVKSQSKSESPEIKVKGWYETSHFAKPVELDKPCTGMSIINNKRNGNAEAEPKKEMEGRLVAPSTHPRSTTRGRESKSQEENERPTSETPICTSNSRNPGKMKEISRKQNTEKHSSRTFKAPNWIFGQGDAETGPPETTTPDRRKTSESAEGSKQEIVENVSDTPSVSPLLGAGIPAKDQVEEPENVVAAEDTTSINLKTISPLKNDETERKIYVTSSREGTNARREGKVLSEATSERSENNYESDFESMTNEPEEHADEREDKEEEATEMFPLVNKLSTISEVDSEMERKLGEEPKASKSRLSETSTRDVHKRELNPNASEVPSREKKEAAVPKTAEGSLKSTSTELVTSLKDILAALQDQFARTESLAEKLTENQKMEKNENPERSFVPVSTDADLVENLRSARKGRAGTLVTPKESATPEKSIVVRKAVDSLSEEGGSSLGEVIVSQRRRRDSANSESGSISENSFLKLGSAANSPRPSARRETRHAFTFKLGVNSEDVSYSEGEIPSENLIDRVSAYSAGEISH